MAPEPVTDQPADEPRGVDGLPRSRASEGGPGSVARVRRGSGGAVIRLQRPAGGLHSHLVVDAGLFVEPSAIDLTQRLVGGRLVVRDAKSGHRLLSFSLPENSGRIEFSQSAAGRYQFDLLPGGASLAAAAGVPPVIDAATTPFATYGGAQGSDSGGGGVAVTGNGAFAFVDAGQLTTKHYAGYLVWDVSSIPASATVTGAWLYPAYVTSFTGAAQTISVPAVYNGPTLAPTATPHDHNNYTPSP